MGKRKFRKDEKMIKKQITPEEVVNFLNEALKNDPVAISSLFQIRVFCNIKTAKHKSIQVFRMGKDSYLVGFIGLLNGMFGANKNGWGCIAANYKGTKILNFLILKDRLK